MPDNISDQNLQQEFNRWAQAGEGEKMRNHHLDITEKTVRLMDLRPGERVLDLGCGSGWATRMLARLVGGRAAGFRPGGRTRYLRRDDPPGARRFKGVRKHSLRLGIGTADSLGRKFLRQGVVGGVVLLLCRPGPRVVRTLSA